MCPAKARLNIEEEGSVAIVTFTASRILDQMMIREIQAEFDVLVGEVGVREVLLDFDGVEALSSSALGAIVTLNDQLRAGGGRLKLAGLNDEIAGLLELTKLNRVLAIYPDRIEALAAFRRGE